MSTTSIDNAIMEFTGRMSEAYGLEEEGKQWVEANLKEIFHPLADKLGGGSTGGEVEVLLKQLLEQRASGGDVTPQSVSPGKKRGLSGWNMFVKHMRETEPEAKHSYQSCSPLWKAMSEEEKEEFNQKAKAVNANAPSTPVGSSGTPGKGKKPNAWNVFCKEFKQKCDAEGEKYDVKKASEAYQKVKGQ